MSGSNQVLDALSWRYAVKTFDPTQKLKEEEIRVLESAIRLAPSSFGLQPYRAVFVSDPEIRTRLRAASYGQAQVTDASHLVVFMTEDVVDDAYVRTILADQPATRVEATIEAIRRKDGQELRAWAARQAYLALGFLLFAAAELRIDASPMEGFEPRRYDEILRAAETRLSGASTSVIAALGRRCATDRFQHFPRHRREVTALFPRIGGK